MKFCSRLVFIFFIVFISSCSIRDAGGIRIFSYSFDFSESDHDWKHGFSDFPVSPDDSTLYELKFAYTNQPITSDKKSLMISGNNHSDDLFMFVKKKLENLAPDTEYTLTFEVEFASDAKAGLVGIGGAPGESVFLKVGATNTEPRTVIENSTYIMNIDKGNQAESGSDMINIGNVAIPENSSSYSLVTLTNAPYKSNAYNSVPLVVRSNSQGQLWLIVGTDSGFEGVTTLYYTKITSILSQAN